MFPPAPLSPPSPPACVPSTVSPHPTPPQVDIIPHLSEGEVLTGLNLDYITDNPWVIVPMSAKHNINVEAVLKWLLEQK